MVGNFFNWLRIDSCNEDKGLISDSIVGPGDLGLVCKHYFFLPSKLVYWFYIDISIILTVFP